MKPVIGLLIGMFAIALPQSSAGAMQDSVLVVPQGWIYGPRTYADGGHPVGENYLFFGLAQRITSPLLESADGAEYTIYIHDAMCTAIGMWDDPHWELGGDLLVVGPSIMEVYRDDTPDADPTDPETYRDGEMILYGSVGEIEFFFDDYQGHVYPLKPPYRVKSSQQFGGGQWFDRVSKDGVGFVGEIVTTSGRYDVPSPTGSQGIVAYFGASLSIDAPVAVKPVTWGNLKSLYR